MDFLAGALGHRISVTDPFALRVRGFASTLLEKAKTSSIDTFVVSYSVLEAALASRVEMNMAIRQRPEMSRSAALRANESMWVYKIIVLCWLWVSL